MFERRQEMSPRETAIMSLNRYRGAQIIHVLAVLGVPDLLTAGPKTAAELAARTDANAAALYRLLRAAAALNLLEELDDGAFRNTPASSVLTSTAPLSLLPYARMIGQHWHWSLWGDLTETVRTGAPAFPRRLGDFDAFRTGPSLEAAAFRAGIDAILSLDLSSVFSLCDFSGCRCVLYPAYGGGAIDFATELLRRYETRLVLLEVETRQDDLRRRLASAGISERCDVRTATQADPPPCGADAHVFRHLLTYHSDAVAVRMTRHSREALPPGGRLLVVTPMITVPNQPDLAKLLDIEGMLVSADAHERSEAEYRGLLSAAGFERIEVLRNDSPTAVIQATRSH